MRRLLLPLACASALSCSDGLFEPLAPVTIPGAAVMHIDGDQFDAEAIFQGSSIRIKALSGDFVADIETIELKDGRARLGRHRLRTTRRDGAHFYLFERVVIISPPLPTPGLRPPGPTHGLRDLNLRVLDGFLEVRSSRTNQVSATLYLRADTGDGTAERSVRIAFNALPEPIYHDPIVPEIPMPQPVSK